MDQQFSLSWNNFHGNLTKGFAGLLGNAEFVDVTIAVDGHLLQAHKVILSICSPYFKKMFQLNPCQHPIIVLRDVTHKAMRDLLQFMYHGEVSVKQEDLTSFIGTAEVLQIKGLTNKESDEDNKDKEKNSLVDPHKDTTEVESHVSTPFCNENKDNTSNDDVQKQKDFYNKLQNLSNLKRKSEEFIPTYFNELLNSDKRPKMLHKTPYSKLNKHILQSNHYDNMKKLYEGKPVDITPIDSQKQVNTRRDSSEIKDEQLSENDLELKTECDDMDIIVTDPAVCNTPKNYDIPKDANKDTIQDYQPPQDNCTSLNSLFIDLKNLVNGKVTNVLHSTNEDLSRFTSEHWLTTIPQKEDGKKKYPQRSCRLCWKIGKRRDTRFMCNACELPFCKSPCFRIHKNDILKVSHLQGDYYAT